LQKKLGTFWAKQNEEIAKTIDFKTNVLPLARIKKIMKTEEGVRHLFCLLRHVKCLLWS